MSATLGGAPSYAFTKGIHPDQHAVVFDSADPRIAFVGSDGGVVRIDVRNPGRRLGRLRRAPAAPGSRSAPTTWPTASAC